MEPLAEYVDGLPNLCGQEPLISEAITAGREYPVFPHDADIQHAASTFAVALHMHQPLIPAGGDLHSAPVISNLAWMMDHQDIGENTMRRYSCDASSAWASSSGSCSARAASPG